ncbi:MAG: 3-deoxy-7-phosphoheptulonate synthase, partial [Pseudomonadota bacterium]
MIVVLQPDMEPADEKFTHIINYISHLPNVSYRIHKEVGTQQTLTEIYLIGDTASLSSEEISALPGVNNVVRISRAYRVLGRHEEDEQRPAYFDYNGIRFGQDTFHLFAGLCAVDTPKHVEQMMQALQAQGQQCARMGAYKPRTNP